MQPSELKMGDLPGELKNSIVRALRDSAVYYQRWPSGGGSIYYNSLADRAEDDQEKVIPLLEDSTRDRYHWHGEENYLAVCKLLGIEVVPELFTEPYLNHIASPAARLRQQISWAGGWDKATVPGILNWRLCQRRDGGRASEATRD